MGRQQFDRDLTLSPVRASRNREQLERAQLDTLPESGMPSSASTASATDIARTASQPTLLISSDAVTCSLCGHCSKILESRPATDSRPLRRRRECAHCRYRWTTYEVRETAYHRAQLLEQNARALKDLLQG